MYAFFSTIVAGALGAHVADKLTLNGLFVLGIVVVVMMALIGAFYPRVASWIF